MEEHSEKPYIIIDDVQLSVDELPEEAQGIFGRVQRLTQKKASVTLDLEEIQAGINFFSSKIVSIVNGKGGQKEVIKEDDVEKEK
tara:strand:+ start:3013 stop:3267 length:255 start_codon:yes stop_codon:yes gene_type:complete